MKKRKLAINWDEYLEDIDELKKIICIVCVAE